jgi:hypothetical protein
MLPHSPMGDEWTFEMLKAALYACQHLGHSRPFARRSRRLLAPELIEAKARSPPRRELASETAAPGATTGFSGGPLPGRYGPLAKSLMK